MKKMKKLLGLLALMLFFTGGKAQPAKTVLPLFMAWDSENSFKTIKTDEEIETYLQRLKKSHIDGIFLEGKPDFIRRVAPIAKQIHLQLHVWKPTMIMADTAFMHKHTDWYSVNRNGESCVTKPPYNTGYYRIFCPREPQVLEYLSNIYLEYAKINGVDGIHFDYIRYCDVFLPKGLLPKYHLVQDTEMPEFDFCYCHRCRAEFKAITGIDPILMQDPASNKKWAEFRLQAIVDIVNTISKKVKKQTGKLVSAAVFPTPAMAKHMVRQDWSRFKIDAVCPMLYNSFYNEGTDWIGKCVNEGIKTMKIKKDLHAGIYMDCLQDPKDFRLAIESAMDNGANGVTFFTARLTDDQLTIIRQMYDKYKNRK